LDGTELASQEDIGQGGEFSFTVLENRGYLLKARTVGGSNIWALADVGTEDTTQHIDLRTTYESGLIFTANTDASIAKGSIDSLKEIAGQALDLGVDRLVNTVGRVVDNALLWRIDYQITTEVDDVNLRAFGGGLEPIRSLSSLVSSPQPDYVPHVYMLNTAAGDLFLDRILMSELKADRWTLIVVTERVPPRVWGGLGGLHLVHGGSNLVYGEDKCARFDGDECALFTQALVTYPLDAAPGTPYTEVISVDDFDGADNPQWSSDERTIAFQGYPAGRLNGSQIYLVKPDGSGLTQLTSTSESPSGASSPSWSPDNSKIIYISKEGTFSSDVWVMNSDGSEKQNLTNGRVDFPSSPKFSPDGRRILFHGSDDVRPERGGPDFEIWIMDRDGSELRKFTDNDVDDRNAVWGVNGVEIIYSVDDETWEAASVLTGTKLYEFPGVTQGRYVSPVLAATEHVLVPTQEAVEAKRVSDEGYVDTEWLATVVEREEARGAGEPAADRGYKVTTPSSDPLSGIRHEIHTAFTQTPIYQSDVGGWFAPIISWP